MSLTPFSRVADRAPDGVARGAAAGAATAAPGSDTRKTDGATAPTAPADGNVELAAASAAGPAAAATRGTAAACSAAAAAAVVRRRRRCRARAPPGPPAGSVAAAVSASEVVATGGPCELSGPETTAQVRRQTPQASLESDGRRHRNRASPATPPSPTLAPPSRGAIAQAFHYPYNSY